MVSYADDDSAASGTGAARVGAELRATREQLGWQLPDMAQNLRIRLPYLQAIEDGRVSDLPGNAYAVGFVRAYATTLGLDADEVARLFRAEAQEVNRQTKLAFPAPVPDRGVPAGVVVLLGVVIAGAAYVGWYRYTAREQGPAQVVAAIPERLTPLLPQPVAPATPPPISPQVAAILPLQPAAPVAPVAPAPAPVLAPFPATIAPLPPPEPADTRILLRANADSWTQVREKQGQILLNRVMHGGETWPVPAKPNLLLTTGNAGGIEVLVDGVATAPLGSAGTVKRDVALDPDQLKLGKPVSTPKLQPQ
jgi:cytoskeleton protein RodZ